MPCNERDCVQKILHHLRCREAMDNDLAGHFTIHYNKLLLLKISPQLRHSLMGFMLALADNSKQAVPPTAVALTAFSGGCGDYLAQVTSSESRSSSYQNGFSQDPSSSSQGISRGVACRDSRESETSSVPSCFDVFRAKRELDPQQSICSSALYSFMGIQGKHLKKDIITGYFKLDPMNTKSLSAVEAAMLLRLSELGYYHDRVAKVADPTTGYNPIGIMGQALICKLRQELVEFRGEVTLLADELKGTKPGGSERHGLMKLLAWSVKPLQRLQWLAKIADKCQLMKGGELASTLYNMLDHGNPMVNDLVRDLLAAVCVPLGRMISKWMLEGGITDLHSEFFVEALNDIGPDRLWHDKFRLRRSMLPKFVPLDLADRILKTGKSINFLREVCEMNDLGANRDRLKETMDENCEWQRIISKYMPNNCILTADQIFSYVQDTIWHAAVETCYAQTSKQVLDIMVGPHKLLDHLYGMRRYLLLGQGDFVCILIQHMKDELERKGTDISAHDLSVMLDAALRCENAHHEDPEILNHLDVVLQPPFPGDCGWDIISLQYTVHGPLATMLEPTMPTYKTIFKPLWRLKHIEYVLSIKIWKTQMCNAKKLHLLDPVIGRTTHSLHRFTSEIMHFIHQMQYYILFEVIECNWVELKKKMLAATALDEILEAHEKFLADITVGCFIGENTSKEKCLETVFENIIALETWQARFYRNCFKELSAREDLEKMVAESEKKGQFGITAEQKLQRDQECKLFEQRVLLDRHTLGDITATYEKAVSGFLLTLNSHVNPNLQLFGTRLDFNEYYKKRDTNLLKPLTFEHMRQSNLFMMNCSNRLMIHPSVKK
ncbi:hypothetical protein KR032_001760 [Drosophila birchii]|nr:hypothetical protein KR032_001760 [Drosophila birchii]